MDVNYGIKLMKMWVKNRRDKGVAPNADDIWLHICNKWIRAPDFQREAVFQAL